MFENNNITPTQDDKPIDWIEHPQLTPWYIRLWRFVTFYRPRFTESNLETYHQCEEPLCKGIKLRELGNKTMCEYYEHYRKTLKHYEPKK